MRNEMPPDATIQAWLEAGLTHQAMADRWYEMSEGRWAPGRKAFSMRISRRGWSTPMERCPLVPWHVVQDHLHLYEPKMLRRVWQLRRGDDLSEHDLSRIDKFLDDLREQKAVIHYEPDTVLDSPFVWVPAEWFDDDIFRDPRLLSLVGSTPPRTRKERIARLKAVLAPAQ